MKPLRPVRRVRTLEVLESAFVWFLGSSEEWSSEYDVIKKEKKRQRAIEAAAECIVAELLATICGHRIPKKFRISDDWRKLAAPLIADQLVAVAKRYRR